MQPDGDISNYYYSLRSLTLKYKDKGIRKSELVTKTQFRYSLENWNEIWEMYFLIKSFVKTLLTRNVTYGSSSWYIKPEIYIR